MAQIINLLGHNVVRPTDPQGDDNPGAPSGAENSEHEDMADVLPSLINGGDDEAMSAPDVDTEDSMDSNASTKLTGKRPQPRRKEKSKQRKKDPPVAPVYSMKETLLPRPKKVVGKKKKVLSKANRAAQKAAASQEEPLAQHKGGMFINGVYQAKGDPVVQLVNETSRQYGKSIDSEHESLNKILLYFRGL